MHFKKFLLFLVLAMFMTNAQVFAQEGEESTDESELKTYVIERNIPKAGEFSMEELVSISQKSCSVIDGMGHNIIWLHSYVTEDKIYCVYRADNEDTLLEHAAKGGFPANNISELSTIISPETAGR